MGKTELLEKLANKTAKVGIIGLGYVGLPLLIRYAEVGLPVLGFELDADKVNKLNEKKSYINHIPDENLQVLQGADVATLDFSRISEVDVVVICVPTPLSEHLEPDLSYVKEAIGLVTPHLKAGTLVSLESTTYPGTTDEFVVPPVQGRGFNLGEDLFVVYSPEREDPNNQSFTTSTIPKVCGGVTKHCLEVGKAFYELGIDQVVPVSSTKTAEMTKILENIYRAVNIGLVNELKILTDKMGIDIHEVIEAAATKPFGFTPFYPGPGLGGHCVPIDPFYLTWKAKEYKFHTRFIELAGQINRGMPNYVVEKITTALNSKQKSVHGSRVLILGMAYKKNVDDMRESPSIEVIKLLNHLGARVTYSDSYFPTFQPGAYEIALESEESIQLTEESLTSVDVVVLLTDHDNVSYELVSKYAPLLVDCKGRFPTSEKLFKA